MADISALGGLAPSEPMDLDLYREGLKRPFPNKGRYTLQAASEFPAASFGVSKAGALTVAIDPTIVSGPHTGTKLRFTRVSAKPYKDRNGATISQLGAYLRACGRKGALSGDPQALADAVEQTANAIFEADLDWRLFAKGEGRLPDGTPTGEDLVLNKMEEFPQNEDGTYRPYVQSVTRTDDEGNPIMLRANLQINRFIAAA